MKYFIRLTLFVFLLGNSFTYPMEHASGAELDADEFGKNEEIRDCQVKMLIATSRIQYLETYIQELGKKVSAIQAPIFDHAKVLRINSELTRLTKSDDMLRAIQYKNSDELTYVCEQCHRKNSEDIDSLFVADQESGSG